MRYTLAIFCLSLLLITKTFATSHPICDEPLNEGNDVELTPSPKPNSDSNLPVSNLPAKESPSTPEDKKQQLWIDTTHAKVTASFCRQVNYIDSFFGKLGGTESAKSFIRFRTNFIWEELDENDSRIEQSVRARVRLPNMNNKIHFLFSDDDQDQQAIPESRQESHDTEVHQLGTLGILLGGVRSEPVDYDFDIGLKSSDGLKIFTRARATLEYWPTDQSNLRLSQSLFWLDGLGFGEVSRFEFNQKLSASEFLRWTTYAEFSEETSGIKLHQELQIFRQIDLKRAISYTIFMDGFTRPTLNASNYGFKVLFRKNFFRPWLFYEVEPEIFWPTAYERDLSLRLNLRLEMQFGEEY